MTERNALGQSPFNDSLGTKSRKINADILNPLYMYEYEYSSFFFFFFFKPECPPAMYFITLIHSRKTTSNSTPKSNFSSSTSAADSTTLSKSWSITTRRATYRASEPTMPVLEGKRNFFPAWGIVNKLNLFS